MNNMDVDSDFNKKYGKKYLENLFSQFQIQRKNGQFSDAILKTDDETEFPVHRMVLSLSCNFFLNLFKLTASYAQPGDAAELNVYVIHSISSGILDMVIEFAYNQMISISEMNAAELAEAAIRFEFGRLQKECFRFLEESMRIENCARIYKLAQRFDNTDLLKKTLKYIKLNFEKISEIRQHVFLSSKDLRSVLKNDYLDVQNEDVVFNSIVSWVNHKPVTRNSEFCGLLGMVRLCLLTPDFFHHRVTNNSHVTQCNSCHATIALAAFSFPGAGDQIERVQFSITNYLFRPRVPSQVILAAGGWTDGRPTDRIESYDFHVDNWYHVGTMRPATAYHGMACLDGFLYIMGGFNGSDYYNTLSIFDPTTKEWSAKSCMHKKRCYVSSCSFGKTIWALGGYNGASRMRSCEAYDPAANQWTLMPSMNVARSDASATSWRGKVYIAGGFSGHEVLRSVECLESATGQWTYITQMNIPRTGCCLTVYQDVLMVLGGFDGQERLQSVEKLNPLSGTWSSLQDMLRARSNFACVVMRNCIYIVGGFNGATTVPHVEKFDGKEWSNAKEMITCRSALIACAIDKVLFKKSYTFLGNQ